MGNLWNECIPLNTKTTKSVRGNKKKTAETGTIQHPSSKNVFIWANNGNVFSSIV